MSQVLVDSTSFRYASQVLRESSLWGSEGPNSVATHALENIVDASLLHEELLYLPESLNAEDALDVVSGAANWAHPVTLPAQQSYELAHAVIEAELAKATNNSHTILKLALSVLKGVGWRLEGMTAPSALVSPDGRYFALVPPSGLTVGRKRDVGLSIADDSVSSLHALVEEEVNVGLRVTDLRSTNGTLVDGKPVQPGGSLIAKGNDSIQFGHTVLTAFTWKKMILSRSPFDKETDPGPYQQTIHFLDGRKSDELLVWDAIRIAHYWATAVALECPLLLHPHRHVTEVVGPRPVGISIIDAAVQAAGARHAFAARIFGASLATVRFPPLTNYVARLQSRSGMTFLDALAEVRVSTPTVRFRKWLRNLELAISEGRGKEIDQAARAVDRACSELSKQLDLRTTKTLKFALPATGLSSELDIPDYQLSVRHSPLYFLQEVASTF